MSAKYDSLSNIFTEKSNDYALFKKYYKNQTLKILLEDSYSNLVTYRNYQSSTDILKYASIIQDLEKSFETLKNDSINITIYEIKTRINTNDGVKLKNYYAYYNNQNDSISIHENADNYPNSIKDLYQDFSSFLNMSSKLQDILINLNISQKKLIDFLK